MFFSKASHLTPQLDDQIYNDFLYFYDLECQLHRRNQDRSSEVNDNVCENIALLDPSSLNAKAGVKRVDYLFGSKSPVYKTGHRIAVFTASCIVKYGPSVMAEYKERCLRSLEEFHVSRDVIRDLDRKYNTFWTYPLFIRAYQNFLYKSVSKQ
jgi:hypothetical protein